MEKIDFVIIWVDGNDADWQAEKAGYSPDKLKEDAENVPSEQPLPTEEVHQSNEE